MSDAVNHPPHYNAHPGGVECIELVERLPFCQGNAIKYLWRADHKGERRQDLEKALWYVRRARRAPGRALLLALSEGDELTLRASCGFGDLRGAAIQAIATQYLKTAEALILELLEGETSGGANPSPSPPAEPVRKR